jgi:hypothetical protein
VVVVKRAKHAVAVIKTGFSEYAPTRGIAFILGMSLLAYGIWLGLPFDSFANPAYAYMADLAAEAVWGAAFTFAGAALSYGVFTKSEEWIQRGSWLGFFLWTVVAIMGVVSAPITPVHIVRLTIALMHAWVYVQVKLHPYLVNGYVSMKDLARFVEANHIQELKNQ